MLDRLHRLAQSLWTGGIVAIDAVATPARFRTEGLDRNQLGRVGRSVFGAFNTYELGLGAVSLLTLRRSGWWRRAAVTAMAGAALTQAAVLRPRMRRLGRALDFEAEDREADPRHAEFRRLHDLYVRLDVVKLGLGLATVLAGGAAPRVGAKSRVG